MILCDPSSYMIYITHLIKLLVKSPREELADDQLPVIASCNRVLKFHYLFERKLHTV